MQNVLAFFSDNVAQWQDIGPPWLVNIAVLVAVAILLLFLHSVLHRMLALALRGRLAEFGQKLLRRIGPPTKLGLLVLGLGITLQALPHRGFDYWLLQWGLLFGFIVFLGWSAITVVNTAAELYLRRAAHGSQDSVLTRKLLTQVRLLRRVVVFVIGFLTLSAILMTIPSVREYGVSLFASAGVAGLAVGLAARPVLSNLIAGIQIAIAQPIRLGDEVMVEGEFGTIEEILTTYVVVKLWDLRRLIVPLSYFMEKPFQNWTRQSSSIVGTVQWSVDYAVPVDTVRAKFLEFVKASRRWDGQVAALQVTDIKDRTVELRGLMSGSSPGTVFDLRCEVREKLVAWLRETNPKAAP